MSAEIRELIQLSAVELTRGYRSRDFTPSEVLDALTAHTEAVDPIVNAFLTRGSEQASKAAEVATKAYQNGEPQGALLGIPVAVKDLFDTAEMRTTYGSAAFRDHVPNRDADVIRRIRDEGGVIIGKTATHEFGWGITTSNPHFGATRNPWALDRVPGGSSGGSAVALATLQTPLAIGSDTGGSIRIPAAFCGVVGMKPTYASVSARGAFPLTLSMDHVGSMARTPSDAALLLDVISGNVHNHPRTLSSRPDPLDGLRRLRVGVCTDLHWMPPDDDVARVWNESLRRIVDLGATLVDLRFPDARAIWSAFGTIQRAEARLVHERQGVLAHDAAGYGEDVRDRLNAAATTSLRDYLEATEERERIRSVFNRLFQSVDLIVTPIGAGPPDVIGADSRLEDRERFRELIMSYTVPQDLVGIPACAVRAGFNSIGVPVGIQFCGPSWHDSQVLRAVTTFFEATRALQDIWPSLQ